jgi:hypothetical protein
MDLRLTIDELRFTNVGAVGLGCVEGAPSLPYCIGSALASSALARGVLYPA